jgi:hypothetical protein
MEKIIRNVVVDCKMIVYLKSPTVWTSYAVEDCTSSAVLPCPA